MPEQFPFIESPDRRRIPNYTRTREVNYVDRAPRPIEKCWDGMDITIREVEGLEDNYEREYVRTVLPTLLPGDTLWTPTSLTTPTLWLDAADASTITLDGSSVTQWNDKSGNTFHATQATAANRPTLLTAEVNGLNAISFDATNDGLQTEANLTRPYHIFFLAKQIAAGNKRIINSRDTNSLISIVRASFNVYLVSGTVFNGAYGSNNTYAMAGLSVSDIENTKFYANTSLIADLASPTANWGRVGFGTSGSSAEPADAVVLEVIVLPRVASLDERHRIEGYFAYKWNRYEALSSSHPYYDYPPIL